VLGGVQEDFMNKNSDSEFLQKKYNNLPAPVLDKISLDLTMPENYYGTCVVV